MAKPERIDLPMGGAVGQRIVRIEHRDFGSPRIHLEDGTFLSPVASGRDHVSVYRMPGGTG